MLLFEGLRSKSRLENRLTLPGASKEVVDDSAAITGALG